MIGISKVNVSNIPVLLVTITLTEGKNIKNKLSKKKQYPQQWTCYSPILRG